MPMIFGILPPASPIMLKTSDIIASITVIIQAHPLPFKRPHDNTKLAIPRTIAIPAVTMTTPTIAPVIVVRSEVKAGFHPLNWIDHQ